MIARKDFEDRCERLEELRYLKKDSYEAALQNEFDTMRSQFEIKVAKMQMDLTNSKR